MATPFKRAEAELLKFALGYPETCEDRPWGERVVKVRKKVFVFFHVPSARLNVTVKLPTSATLALGLPFVKPTGYGLGKSGWVTATFGPKRRPNLAMLKQWIDESYRAVAPKKLHPRMSE
jgi:predicted DNA-binding protein (MmcQ/YjbR family)